jgi:hypothetical protein
MLLPNLPYPPVQKPQVHRIGSSIDSINMEVQNIYRVVGLRRAPAPPSLINYPKFLSTSSLDSIARCYVSHDCDLGEGQL